MVHFLKTNTKESTRFYIKRQAYLIEELKTCQDAKIQNGFVCCINIIPSTFLCQVKTIAIILVIQWLQALDVSFHANDKYLQLTALLEWLLKCNMPVILSLYENWDTTNKYTKNKYHHTDNIIIQVYML